MENENFIEDIDLHMDVEEARYFTPEDAQEFFDDPDNEMLIYYEPCS